MNKFILPVLAAMILLVPQPAEAWSGGRRNPWAEFGTTIALPYAFTILLVSGMHLTWPLEYKGEHRNK
jgi:hypothetical protein